MLHSRHLPTAHTVQTCRSALVNTVADAVQHFIVEAAAPPLATQEIAVRLALEGMVLGVLTSQAATGTGEEHARERIFKVLRVRYADPTLSESSLARELGMSKRILRHLLDGQSVHHHVSHLRLQAVLAHLAMPHNSHLSLADVAVRTGFASVCTMRRAVAAYTGMSPSEFRHRHLLGGDRGASSSPVSRTSHPRHIHQRGRSSPFHMTFDDHGDVRFQEHHCRSHA
jgi:transcriptional regulator GlxA family with amidase domain